MRLRYLLAVCLAILCLVQSACAPRGPRPEVAHPAIPADLVLVRSINAQTAESAHMESASLNISDPKNLAGQFEERLERMLVERQFTLTDQPSLAERIISLKILYKGEAGREDMERVVKTGYDTPVPELFGEGGVLVADLLLVRRRVPSANMKLSTISARNAMSSSTLRIGLHSSSANSLKDRSLEEALARDIAKLAASDEDTEVHKTSSLTLQKKKYTKKRKKSAKKSSRKRSSRR